ncbi:MAG: TIGR00701 family protein [Gammaproteobacteria bacterium]|nr:TIGR00701 family protein [Gammaproteobacteria bacterium]|tara:strand:- start:374 stop:802 length:429 start_codon:yes stop_codon:yes gene_type:complete
MTFLWVKAFHLIFVITWFAGLFYLPRLFVYHSATTDVTSSERFKIMERKLYKAIMTPSMILAVGLGLILFSFNWVIYSQTIWMWAKIVLVSILIMYHFYCGNVVKAFEHDQNKHTEIFYRWFNEIPAVILIATVIMVVVKPS